MSKENIETLEKMIFVSINTQYPEERPSEEDFLKEAETLRAVLSTRFPVDDQEFQET